VEAIIDTLPAPTVDPRSLDLLIERAAGGDTRAFEGLMRATERRVVAVAWRLLADREQARDAVQEVYLRVHRSLPRFRRGEDFHAWLYRIAVNVCHDLARKRRPAASLDDVPEPAVAGASENELLRAERWRHLREALAALPAGERAALVLRDLEGHSTEEVARLLGTRPATVRSQISTARAKVRLFCDRVLGGAR